MSSTMPESSSIGPVEAFWRFRSWTVPITIVVGILAGLAALATSGTSTATTTLYLTDPRGAPVFRDGSSNPADLERWAEQRADFAKSAAVRTQVAAAIEAQRAQLAASADAPPESEWPRSEDLDSLDSVVDTRATSSSDVRIECTSTDEARSLLVCEETVVAYVDLTQADTDARAEAAIAALLLERDRLIADPDTTDNNGAIAEIDLKIAEIRSEAVLFGSGVEFFDPPEVQEDSRLLPAIQFGIAGLLFAGFATAAVAWFRAGRRPVVTSGSDAAVELRTPLLGEISVAPDDPFDPVTPPGGSYQLLATSLRAVHPQGGIVLAGTATPNPDAADIVARVAAASARDGQRVLVIDGDLRDRRVSRLFGIEQSSGGLTELLAGLTGFADVRRPVGVGGAATLDVVTGGRQVDDPASLLRSEAARTTLTSLRECYDLVLIDVPPLLTVADGSALAGDADGVVMIVERGTESHDLETVRQRLEVLRAPLLGVVFDHRTSEHGR